MKTQMAALLSGFGMALAGAFVVHRYAKRELMKWGTTPDKERAQRVAQSRAARAPEIDLNTASREQLATLGIEDYAVLDRIYENRPYRHKLDLVSRMVISRDLYHRIRNRICIATPEEALKVAS